MIWSSCFHFISSMFTCSHCFSEIDPLFLKIFIAGINGNLCSKSTSSQVVYNCLGICPFLLVYTTMEFGAAQDLILISQFFVLLDMFISWSLTSILYVLLIFANNRNHWSRFFAFNVLFRLHSILVSHTWHIWGITCRYVYVSSPMGLCCCFITERFEFVLFFPFWFFWCQHMILWTPAGRGLKSRIIFICHSWLKHRCVIRINKIFRIRSIMIQFNFAVLFLILNESKILIIRSICW